MRLPQWLPPSMSAFERRRRAVHLNNESEPIFNVPPVVTIILLALALIHAVREFVLTSHADLEVLLRFAFIPARYEATPLVQGAYPGGIAADVWTFVSYAFLHGDWVHLSLNGVWFLAFGTPVACRFGPGRFLAFFAATAAAGAVIHLATHGGDSSPMIGASAAISGCMAAAIRFVFQANGPLGLLAGHDGSANTVPAAPLATALRDPRIVAFLAIWFGLNLLFGVGSLAITTEGQAVAWQAHVGGFLAGLLGFWAFDPIGQTPPHRPDPAATQPHSH
jgi:membrane associated rhomboid family serine protease